MIIDVVIKNEFFMDEIGFSLKKYYPSYKNKEKDTL